MSEPTADSRPLFIVSTDSHVSPPLEEYRRYCPEEYLEDFDGFVADNPVAAGGDKTHHGMKTEDAKDFKAALKAILDQKAVHFDPHAVLAEMDKDGIVAQVVFHGAQNRHPIPFVVGPFGGAEPVASARRPDELARAGLRMYNRWLADFCSVSPDRFVGLAQLPMWNIDAAVEDLEYARSLGLRGLNFPAPRPSIPDYNSLVWEPLWSAAAANDMTLNTHGASSPIVHDIAKYDGVNSVHSFILDLITFSWRGLQFMLLGGVFERHPDLKMVLTEQPPEWVPSSLRDVDALWRFARYDSTLPKPPSEYFHSNCFIGASFMSRLEAECAIENGLTHNVMWGSDFPHIEGTWPYTRLSLRSSMEGIPADVVKRLLGENAMKVYGLDHDALAPVVEAIAPTTREVLTPLGPDELPEGRIWSKGFRTEAGFFS